MCRFSGGRVFGVRELLRRIFLGPGDVIGWHQGYLLPSRRTADRRGYRPRELANTQQQRWMEETKFVRVTHGGEAHFIALHTGLNPAEVSR